MNISLLPDGPVSYESLALLQEGTAGVWVPDPAHESEIVSGQKGCTLSKTHVLSFWFANEGTAYWVQYTGTRWVVRSVLTETFPGHFLAEVPGIRVVDELNFEEQNLSTPFVPLSEVAY